MTSSAQAKHEESDLSVDGSKHLRVRFLTDAVVASWWVHLVEDQTIVRTWKGDTLDKAADEAIVSQDDLRNGRSVLWQLVLFGATTGPVSYQIGVIASQHDGAEDEMKRTGELKERKTELLAGEWRIRRGGP